MKRVPTRARWRLALALALAALGVGIPREASADPLASSVVWQQRPGAESCVSEVELRTEVEQRLGRPLVSSAHAALRVNGIVSAKTPNGWRATLSVDDGSGNTGVRDLDTDDPSCASLRRAIVLAVVLAIDPDAAFKPEKQANPIAAPIESAPPVVSLSPPASPPRDAPAPSERAGRFRYSIGAAGAVAVGLVPGAGVGGRAFGSFAHSFWSVEASVTILATTSTNDQGPHGEIDLALGGVALCPLHLERAAWSGGICGGLEVGAMSARGIGFDNDRNVSSWFVSPTLALDAEVRMVGPIWATGRAILFVPAVHPDVVYEDAAGASHLLYHSPAASGLLSVGAAVHFPS